MQLAKKNGHTATPGFYDVHQTVPSLVGKEKHTAIRYNNFKQNAGTQNTVNAAEKERQQHPQHQQPQHHPGHVR